MNELARMQYLEAMGIETFVPRLILPAAKRSTQAALPVVWIDEVVSSAPDEPIRAGLGELIAPPQASNLVQELLAPSKALTKESVQTSAPEARTLQQLLVPSRAPVLRFSLSVWQLENGIVIIDSREPRGALPTSTLLKNILSVLAPNLAIPKPDLINWPLLQSETPNANAMADAREMTLAFLASRFEVVEPKLVVALGGMAVKMIVQQEGYELGQSHSVAHLPCPVMVLPSLTEFLKQPLLKRHLWPALKPWF